MERKCFLNGHKSPTCTNVTQSLSKVTVAHFVLAVLNLAIYFPSTSPNSYTFFSKSPMVIEDSSFHSRGGLSWYEGLNAIES